MFILKLAGKILLLPVWLILFMIGLAVKMTVQTYAVVRGILGFIFTLLIIATAYCYHDWVLASSFTFSDPWISNVDVARWLMENMKLHYIHLVVMLQKAFIITILMKIIR